MHWGNNKQGFPWPAAQGCWRASVALLEFFARYGNAHAAVELQKEAVYGLTELYREHVKTARLLANPGCYPTCAQVWCMVWLSVCLTFFQLLFIKHPSQPVLAFILQNQDIVTQKHQAHAINSCHLRLAWGVRCFPLLCGRPSHAKVVHRCVSNRTLGTYCCTALWCPPLQLPLYPLVKSKLVLPEDIIIDAKSGKKPV